MTRYNSLAPLDVLVLDIKPFSSLFIKAIYLVPETASLFNEIFIQMFLSSLYKMLFYRALGMSIGISLV